jgi:beta-xylosidase
MQELDQDTKSKIEVLIQDAMDSFNPADIDKSIDKLKLAWNTLPEQKNQWDESYLITKYISIVLFNAKQFDQLKSWVPLYLECDHINRSHGESELIAGKLEFVNGNKSDALDYFKIANTKSDGRVWDEEDLEYFKFFKSKS